MRTIFNHEKIIPFVLFCSGSDFKEDYIMCKVSALNEFYPVDRIYFQKIDGNSDSNFFAPVSIFSKREK
jgi:hypothetical protein